MVGNPAVIRALGGILYCVSVNDTGTLAVWASELQQAANALSRSNRSKQPTTTTKPSNNGGRRRKSQTVAMPPMAPE